MSNIMVVNATSSETRVALVENGIISEFHIERHRERGVVGNVYKGKVIRVLPGMQAAFVDIARVLQSPRCMNCHPKGDAPLQTDLSIPHAMNISRASEAAGLKCSTCHREQNADAVGAPAGAPPGAPNWHLPSKEMPLIFEGRSVPALCAQLRDPAQNGHKTLEQLVEHVSHDALVLWGWNPGKGRTLPPLKHADFVARFKAWAAAGGPCPE